MIDRLPQSQETGRESQRLHNQNMEVPSDFVGPVQLQLGDTKLKILRVADLPEGRNGRIYGDNTINPEVPFLLVADEPDKPGLKGLRVGDPVYLGRSKQGSIDRFPFLLNDDTISRHHATITVGETGEISISDHSTNGTHVSYERPSPETNPWLQQEETLPRDSWEDLTKYRPQPFLQPVVEQSHDQAANLERFSERIRLLATPLEWDIDGVSVKSSESKPGAYDYLFDVGVEDSRLVDVEAAAVRIPKREQTSESSVRMAQALLNQLRKNSEFQTITRYTGEDSRGMINELRRNHAMRCGLVEMFMKAVNDVRIVDPDSLADRVRYDNPNNLKAVNHDGYPVDKMRSSEYVAMLVLSMIDASFDDNRADPTQSHVGANGMPGYGQHREAAYRVLRYLSRY